MNTETTHARAQHLLITVLGDYWWCRPEPLPSVGIVHVLSAFGVGVDATRSALSRLTRRGLLKRSQRGRHTSYELTEQTIHILREGAERLFNFGMDEAHWDGLWSVVAFSIPEQERTVRHVLRTRLRWLTFGPLYDGLWISPHSRLDTVARLLDELHIETATLFRARMESGFPKEQELLRAWDIKDLCRRYEAFIEQYEPLAQRVQGGLVQSEEALVVRTTVMDAWRRFPHEDPDLPRDFLPPDWPRDKARTLCMNIYNTLKSLAEQRFNELICCEENGEK